MSYFKNDKIQLAARKEALRNELASKGVQLWEKYLETIVTFQLRLETNINEAQLAYVDNDIVQDFIIETCRELIEEFRESDDWDAFGCIHLYLGSQGLHPHP